MVVGILVNADLLVYMVKPNLWLWQTCDPLYPTTPPRIPTHVTGSSCCWRRDGGVGKTWEVDGKPWSNKPPVLGMPQIIRSGLPDLALILNSISTSFTYRVPSSVGEEMVLRFPPILRSYTIAVVVLSGVTRHILFESPPPSIGEGSATYLASSPAIRFVVFVVLLCFPACKAGI